MLSKFKDFDVHEYLEKKRILKEALENDAMDIQDGEEQFTEDEVIGGTAVYENPYLLKISRIVLRKLNSSNMGKFGIYYDIVYLNDVPGVWFYGLDDDTKNIVCCRDTNGKSISVFNSFEVGVANTAKVTYSTEKLGFNDMIDQMIYDMQNPEGLNESVLNEAIRYGDGWTADNVKRFEKLDWRDKDFVYDFIRKFGKGKAVSEFFDLIASNDPDACRIVSVFVNGPAKKDGDGQARYLMGFADSVINIATGGRVALSVQKAVDAGILDKLVAEYKGGAPAIRTSAGETFTVAEDESAEDKARAERDARLEDMIKEDTEKYEETLIGLRDNVEAMCNYVKQSGKLDAEDESVLSSRGVLLTGKGGIGKTHTIKTVLKEKGMRENVDYLWISSDTTTSDNIYKALYEYNGKLIIFDDAPKLFDGDYRVSLWKNALQTDLEDCRVGYPKDESKLNVYNFRALKGDRQRRYLMEIGSKTDEEKRTFYKKEMKKKGLSYSKRTRGGIISEDGLDTTEIDAIMLNIHDAWEEEERNAKPAMPNMFFFTGVVIIISNDERDKFRQTVGKGGWDAITSRFTNFDISPMAESLWRVMKKKIMSEYEDTTIDNNNCVIPRDMTPDFIAEVEKLMSDQRHGGIQWRTLKKFSKILRGEKGRRTWKLKLEQELSADK